MPVRARTFRVFVSSTFEDLKEERDALQRDVFPRLRELCAQRGARFQAIDLRWGVRDEAALDQKTMEICLREIERCQRTGLKPNFIVLLGRRYGWRPLPARIEAQEFEAIRERIAAAEDRAAVSDWYRRDDNAVPPEYLLQARSGEWTIFERWQPLEERLHRVLLRAAQAAGLPAAALVKYEASATHQEILKGLGTTPEDRRHVFVFCRNVPGEACDEDLVGLRRFLEVQLPAGNIFFYDPGDFASLCRHVEHHLREVIEAAAAGFESRPPLELEISAHDAFAASRAVVFGCESVLGAIADYIGGGGERPLVVHGASGSGKSAVMAQASDRARFAVPTASVVRRFIGATPDSSNGLTLLRSLAEQIGSEYGASGELPVDYKGVVRVFRERLALASAERPLALFIDALDQLGKSDPAQSFGWLAEALPPHCRIVLSTTSPAPPTSAWPALELERMSAENAGAALDFWLWEAGRKLQPAQRERLLAAFARCGLPLYLKLAFQEAREWPSWLGADECVLGEGIDGIIGDLFGRLSREANHGGVLATRSLGYLAAARYGLTEDEMLDVLSLDRAVRADCRAHAHHRMLERRLPVIIWARLAADLAPYLTEQLSHGTPLLRFFHRQIAEAAARFSGRTRHHVLAYYFRRQPDWRAEAPNIRKAEELPFQQRLGERGKALRRTLLDYGFLEMKCMAGLSGDLAADYPDTDAELLTIRQALELSEHVLAREPAQLPCQLWGRLSDFDEPYVRGLLEQVRPRTSRMWLRPMQPCFDAPGGRLIRTLEGHSGAVNAVTITPDGRRAISGGQDRIVKVWDLATGCELHALAGHSFVDGMAAAYIAQLTGEIPRAKDVGYINSVAMTPDGRCIISAGGDRTLKVWDSDTGVELRTLTGHRAAVDWVRVTPDGLRAVSASSDDSLKVWDIETGQVIESLDTPSHGGLALTADGRHIVSASRGKVVIRELRGGRQIGVVDGLLPNDEPFAVTFDGRQVASCMAGTLRFWSLETGGEVRHLPAPRGRTGVSPSALSISNDGSRAVAGFRDGSLSIWDLNAGSLMCSVDAHAGRIAQIALSPDGRRAVSASDDGTLKYWNLEPSREPRAKIGHHSAVIGVACTADRRRAVSASRSETTIWDLETGRALQTLDTPSWRQSRGVAVTPDGRWIVHGELSVWDAETGGRVGDLEHAGESGGVAVTGDGRRVLAIAWNREPMVWDLETRCLLRHMSVSVPGNSVDVSPDGQLIASTSRELRRDFLSLTPSVMIHDMATGRFLRSLKGHARDIHGVAYSPDGRWIVSGSADTTLKIWDTETGDCLHTLAGHSASVAGVAVSPEGGHIISISADRTARVWDLARAREVALFCLQGEGTCCLAYGSNRFLAGDSSGRIYFLQLEGLPDGSAGVVPSLPDAGLSTLDAEEQLRREIEACTAALGAQDPSTLRTRLVLAIRTGAHDEAAAIREQLQAALQPPAPPPPPAPVEIGEQEEGSVQSYGEHIAALARCLRPAALVWTGAAIAAAILFRNILSAPIGGALCAYPFFCWGLYRFALPGLYRAERWLAIAAFAALAALAGGLAWLLYPLDPWWAYRWPALPVSALLVLGKVVAALVLFGALTARYAGKLAAGRSTPRRSSVLGLAAVLALLLLPAAVANGMLLVWCLSTGCSAVVSLLRKKP